MARSSFISHTVNGYSRYDVPESKAFTCTPGILYPVRIDFINARDRVTIAQGIDVRSNPLAVPSFNPYTVRLHRFWVPLQLYHPEMRTNSSKFDMNDLSLNWIQARINTVSASFNVSSAFSNSLMAWLRVAGKYCLVPSISESFVTNSLGDDAKLFTWANADTYLAYWDIVRNYYSYSQWSLYSFAWPASWYCYRNTLSSGALGFGYEETQRFFTQRFGNLEFLDAYFESQFYPNAVSSTNNTYNRSNLFFQIINSDLVNSSSGYGSAGNGFPVSSQFVTTDPIGKGGDGPTGQFSVAAGDGTIKTCGLFLLAHPMAVVPSNPDRFSRLIPVGSSSAVSTTGVQTIPQLAIASRLQEYKDLLGAGGSRFSDWLDTFFASRIEHVDRPKLLFSASQTVNVQVVMNQAGGNNFQTDSNGSGFPLGQQGGAIAFNSQLGRSQSYYFREPGYMIDMLSIRPVYYWAGITPDYLTYKGADYFNPIYNDIGYQSVARGLFFTASNTPDTQVAQEPCYNEFRASYDEVLGQISAAHGDVNAAGGQSYPLYAYWVQQRAMLNKVGQFFSSAYYACLFVDMNQVNSPFASNVEDNFFVNMSYSVRKKNLVNKTFATRLSNR